MHLFCNSNNCPLFGSYLNTVNLHFTANWYMKMLVVKRRGPPKRIFNLMALKQCFEVKLMVTVLWSDCKTEVLVHMNGTNREYSKSVASVYTERQYQHCIHTDAPD